MLSSTRNNTENENVGGALRGKASVTQSVTARGKTGSLSGLTLRDTNMSAFENKVAPTQHPTVKKRIQVKAKVRADDEIENMPLPSLEPDTYDDIMRFDQRPGAAILRKIFCIPHNADSEDEDKEEVIQWPSLTRFCPFSDDPSLTCEEISEEFEPCLLSEVEEDSDNMAEGKDI